MAKNDDKLGGRYQLIKVIEKLQGLACFLALDLQTESDVEIWVVLERTLAADGLIHFYRAKEYVVSLPGEYLPRYLGEGFTGHRYLVLDHGVALTSMCISLLNPGDAFDPLGQLAVDAHQDSTGIVYQK